MGIVKYHGDIAKFLPVMENLHIHHRVTVIAWRKMIEDQIREDALQRLSLREYGDDGEWLEAVRTVMRAEEDFTELKSLQGGGPSATPRADKRKLEDSKPTVAAKRVTKQYTAKEKGDYRKKKAGERKLKREGSVVPAGEVKQMMWGEAHNGIHQKVVDMRKLDNECSRRAMKNHAWKYGRKPVQVSAGYRGPAKPKRQLSSTPTGCPQVATVAVDDQGESSGRWV